VATSINNLELHDIARSCMTFGIKICYIVTPLSKQRMIMERLIEHWRYGYGADYNPLRSSALSKIVMKESLEGLIKEIKKDKNTMLIGTSSRVKPNKTLGYDELRSIIYNDDINTLLLFGTGWGLTDETIEICDKMLEPIKGISDYNHLSLRVAIGIILDRIFGIRGGKDERSN